MQLCNHCGKGIIIDAKYCSKCGKEEVLKIEPIKKPTEKVELFYYHGKKKKVNKIQSFIINIVLSVILIIIVVVNLPFLYSENEDSEVSGYSYIPAPRTELSEPEPTREIELGMTDDEVRSILGEPTEVLNTPSDSKGKIRFRWTYKGHGAVLFLSISF